MDSNITNKKVENFILLVKDIVLDVLNQNNINIEKCYDGIVVSYDSENNKANVKSGDYLFEDIPNRTGEILAENNVVRVKTTTLTFSDAYVGVKLN